MYNIQYIYCIVHHFIIFHHTCFVDIHIDSIEVLYNIFIIDIVRMILNDSNSNTTESSDVKTPTVPTTTTTTTMNPWNKIPPIQPVATLASIMVDQEQEEKKIKITVSEFRASDTIHDDEEISSDVMKQIQSMETEEERLIRLAIEASLKDSADQDKNESIDSKPKRELDEVDHDIELAIKLSLQETKNKNELDCKPSHLKTNIDTNENIQALEPSNNLPSGVTSQVLNVDSSNNDSFLTKEEEEQIRLAILEADDAEAAQSLKLALELQAEEDRFNYQAKVNQLKSGVSQSNIRFVTKAELEEEANDQLIYENERKIYSHRDVHIHSSDYIHEIYYHECEDHEYDMKPMSGYQMNSNMPSSWSRSGRNTIMKDNEVRTKHDVSLKNKVNAEKLLGSNYKIAKKGGDLAVSDKAYNSFNQSLKNSLKRSVVKGVERSGTGRAENITEKTRGGAMDSNVRLLITKVINNGLIQHCNGVVKEGKEAVVYHADAGTESEGFDVAVKVFKRISEFRNRGSYIDNDPRYHGQKFRNVDNREQVELWAEKEYRNLLRANRAGVFVPTPLLQVSQNDLLLMFFFSSNDLFSKICIDTY
jgi:hypothetical protein